MSLVLGLVYFALFLEMTHKQVEWTQELLIWNDTIFDMVQNLQTRPDRVLSPLNRQSLA